MRASKGCLKCSFVDKREIEKLVHISNEVSQAGRILPPTLSAAMHKSGMQYMKRRSKLARSLLGKLYSMYPIENAWSDVCFGANEQGDL